MSGGSVARHAFVAGRVQGVGFRWATKREAERLGLGGWVRNLVDGRVETHFEGAPEAVAALESWLARGPLPARVDSLEVSETEPEGLRAFGVVRPALGDL
ncbi:MAG: acylphosphatase [Planctomycetota bacterium]